MAKATAKIRVQKRARRWKWSLPVRRHKTSSVAINADRPMLKAGKMMWKLIVKANCSRERSRGSVFTGRFWHPRTDVRDSLGWGIPGSATPRASSCL
jgi:hypothetical protein